MNVDAAHAPGDWRTRKSHLVTQPFALALANSAVPTVLCDAGLEDYPIVFANASFLRLTGCEEDEVLGRNIRFLNAVDADAEVVRLVEDAVVAGEAASVDIRMTRRDGRSFWARMDPAPIFGPDGRASMFVATLVDVSERVRAVRGLRAAEETLERRVGERTAALESALANIELLSREISHRTKNALTILAALIEIKRRRASSPAVADALAEVSGQVRAMARLHGLLESVGREETRVDLGELLAALVEELDASSETRVVVGELPREPVAGDVALALSLAVTELVLNAEKHGFGDGRNGIVIVAAASHDATISVTVSDNGTGLPEGFDPAASHGIGMLVVLDQVRKLHGRLDLGRSPTGGAEFSIVFPR